MLLASPLAPERVERSASIEQRLRVIARPDLDVFAREPLAADSPLWDMPHVLPHGMSTACDENQQLAELLCDRLWRNLHDQPLRNRVDKIRGY